MSPITCEMGRSSHSIAITFISSGPPYLQQAVVVLPHRILMPSGLAHEKADPAERPGVGIEECLVETVILNTKV
jgi:hypothetical protein